MKKEIEKILKEVANRNISSYEANELINELKQKRISLSNEHDNDAGDFVNESAHLSAIQRLTAVPLKTDFNQEPSLEVANKLQNEIVKYIVWKIACFLDVTKEDVDAEENLMEMGIDSFKLLSLSQEIEQDLDVELYPTIFFEYQNIVQLSEYFAEEYRTKLTAYFNIKESNEKSNKSLSFEAGEAEDCPLAGAVDIAEGKTIIKDIKSAAKIITNSVSARPNQNHPAADIAIIGMSGVFPGSPDVDSFWENLKSKKDLIREIPHDHFDFKPWFDANSKSPDKMYCKWGGFIDDVDKFDAGFFNISPREAEVMDPQLRYLLQVLYAAAEDAGCAGNLRGSNTGVYAGVCCHDYEKEMDRRGMAISPYEGTGNAATMIANRPSFCFDLKGPSLAVDTACSSSLVALHIACGALRANECDMAFVAGVNFLLSSWHYRYFCGIGVLSHSGRCHTFDKRADGYIPGEGAAAILIKPLDKAIADRDQIHAVIKGSAINHGGYTPSVTAPSVKLEARVIMDAWKNARIDPGELGYIEAHGTGTKLGDPVEINGLKTAFKDYSVKESSCAIGSAKAHIGHLEGAAGIAGVIKVILSMKNREIPAMPMLDELNPYIKLDESPLYINREVEKWDKKNGAPRMAGVSSFGFGGAYAHVVLEEYGSPASENDAAKDRDDDPQLIVLSAKSEEALNIYAGKLLNFIEKSYAEVQIDTDTDEGLKLSIMNNLLEIVSEIISVSSDEITASEELIEYGFDAVESAELISRINNRNNLDLSVNLFREYSSIESLSGYLAREYKDSFSGQGSDETRDNLNNTAKVSSLKLSDIAYTLQTGRESMSYRLAVIAAGADELREKLTEYCQGKKDIENLHIGNIKKGKDKSDLLLDGEEGREYLRIVFKGRKLDKLARLWASGAEIDWELLCPDIKPRRVSLPTYPFARERYWMSESDISENIRFAASGKTTALHPMIDANTSNLKEQKFTKELTGNEFYLTDHIVAGKKALPGVAYLEMARASGELAGENRIRKITNIIWAIPITMNGASRKVDISLYPDGSRVNYEVNALSDDGNRILHSKGNLIYENNNRSRQGDNFINLEAIKKRCGKTKTAKECYSLFQNIGLQYGRAFQGIEELFYNETEALSRLVLPEALEENFKDFVLHPTLMDGALQTVIGLLSNSDTEFDIFLPFALGEVDIIEPLPEICYAYAVLADKKQPGKSQVKRYNIRLADESGRALVDMKDFSLRPLQSSKIVNSIAAVKSEVPAAETNAVMYYRRMWEKSEICAETGELGELNNVLIFDVNEDLKNAVNNRSGNGKKRNNQVILVKQGECFCEKENMVFEINPERQEDYFQLVGSIKDKYSMPEKIIHLWPQDNFSSAEKILKTQLDIGVYSLFYLSKALIEHKIKNSIQLLYFYQSNNNAGQPQYAAAGGVAKTIRMENPKYFYKTIEIQNSSKNQPHLAQSYILDIALREFQTKGENVEIRYVDSQRFVKSLREFNTGNETDKPLPLKDKGVYVITGGTGALGLLFAKHIAKHVNARFALTDIFDLNEEKKSKVQELESLGSDVIYIKADISEKKDVKKLIEKVESKFENIDGIIHCAGVSRDSLIMRKTRKEFETVLAPKVHGTVNLDEETKNKNLDFFVMFSSVAAVMGNSGQSDYASANSFMDSYADYRDDLLKMKKRSGMTVSINWPLWQRGGMRMNEQTRIWMEKRMGIVPLKTEDGLKAFERALTQDSSGMIVFAGGRAKINKLLKIKEAPVVASSESLNNTSSDKKSIKNSNENLREKVERHLIRMSAMLLKVKEDELETDVEFSEYGVDSIMIMEMLNCIEDEYDDAIEPNVFAEYTTIKHLAEYLIREGIAKNHESSIQGEAAGSALDCRDQNVENKAVAESANNENRKSRFIQSQNSISASHERESKKIAVIGMACRYPQSSNLKIFWNNLKNGRNLITEIPEERWNIAEYFSSDKSAHNKTYSKWGGYIDKIDLFDAEYFGIKDEDAITLDPQHRILLELTQELFDLSGYTKDDISGTKTSVFIGGGESSYLRNNPGGIPEPYMKHYIVNSIQNMMASRISDFYNLRAHSLTIDTACSSSLVAIHQACQSINVGESDMAVVGGIELLIDPFPHIGFSKAGVLSEDGVSYVFDEKANGFVLGEGAGLVLLKSYEAAIEDGDQIIGVILGSAVNNDGHTMGLTTPNMEGQKDVIRQAIDNSGISPESITYLEAHGTGTLLGDPIEIKATSQVYRKYTQENQFCAAGSVKSNMGHLLRAAGAAGVIKTLLAMRNRYLPPTLNCSKPHPRFKFEKSPFYPITKGKEWAPVNGIRRAAISSFGFGGTNCHMILEEFTGSNNNGYAAARRPLPVTQFKRKRYWLGKEIVSVNESNDSNFDKEFYRQIFIKLSQGSLSPDQAAEFSNSRH